MKKVLFIANVAKEHINKFHLPTIQHFKDLGWQADVICKADATVPYCDKLYEAVWERTPFTFKTIKGIKQLKKILEEEHYDVVYCHTPVGGFIARMASVKARKNGTKVIYYAHGLHFYRGASLFGWSFYPIEKFLSYRTDAMFLLNDEDYSIAKRKFNKHMQVFQFPGIGATLERLAISNKSSVREKYRNDLNIADNDIVLIYIAELIPNKNQGYLLRMLQILEKKYPFVKLMLVGPDHTDGHFKKMAKELKVDNLVIFTGWRADIGELLCACDISVASSIREGFGINIVEAMYCGLPVVAVDNRGHRTIIHDGENGFLVSLKNCNEMADRVSQIIENPDLRNKFSHIDVSRYEAHRVAESIVKKIEEICE